MPVYHGGGKSLSRQSIPRYCDGYLCERWRFKKDFTRVMYKDKDGRRTYKWFCKEHVPEGVINGICER